MTEALNSEENTIEYAEHEMAVDLGNETEKNIRDTGGTSIKSYYDWTRDPATRIALVTGLASVIVTLLNVLIR